MVGRGEWDKVVMHFSTYAFMTRHLIAVIMKIEHALNLACQPGSFTIIIIIIVIIVVVITIIIIVIIIIIIIVITIIIIIIIIIVIIFIIMFIDTIIVIIITVTKFVSSNCPCSFYEFLLFFYYILS